MTALIPLQIPGDLPKHARDTLAAFDDGYRRAAVIAAYDPAEMRRHAQATRDGGLEWAAEMIEARARIIEIDPRLEIAGSALVQSDGATQHLLRLYCDLIQEQAEARKNIARAA